MANRNITCGPDAFAVSIAALVGDIPEACGDGCAKAVSQSVRKGAQELRGEKTAGIGRHPWSEKYRGGFKSSVNRNGLSTVGEIGNAAKPGLVHLLEKGHATLHGRRTGAFKHMEPTFNDISESFVELVKRYVGEAL